MTAPALISFAPGERTSVRVTTIARFALVGLLIGNLGRIPAFSTGQRDAVILLNDVLVAMLIAAGVVRATAARSLRLDGIAALALLFALVGGASTLLSIPRFGLTGGEVLVSLSYLVRWLFYFAIYITLINALRGDDARHLWRTLEAVILIFAAFGIVQSIALPNFAQLVYPASRLGADWDPQGHRLVSTWLDPVFAGAFIDIGLLLELGCIAAGHHVARWKPALLTTALLFTTSRGSLGALFVGIGVIMLARGLSKAAVRATVALVALVGLGVPIVLRFTGMSQKLGIFDLSALQRVVAWLRAWHVFSQHPIVGIGFNAWAFVQERYGYARLYAFSYSLDGGVIFIAVMTGLIGVALYCGMVLLALRRARAVWRAPAVSPEDRGLAIGIAASTVALIAHSLFGNSLFLPFLMETMWILWAMLFAIRRRASAGRQAGLEGDVLNADRAALLRV